MVVGVAASIEIALANVLLAVAAVAWIAGLATHAVPRPRGAILLPIAAYAAVSILSAMLSAKPWASLGELGDLLTLTLVPMTLSLLDHRLWDRLILLLAAVLALSSAVGLAQYILASDPLQHRIRGLATHYMTFSGWSLVVTLLLLGEVLFAVDHRRLLWTLPAVVLGLSALLLGLTRGAWLGLATGLLLALAVARPRALILLPLVAVFLYLALPTSILERAASTFDLREPAARERLQMFAAGIEMAREYPVLGLGPGLVQPAFAAYRSNDAPERVPHLHSNVVQIAAERGFVGLLSYLSVIAVFVAHASRALQHGPEGSKAPIIGCLMAVVGVTTAGLFEYNWGDAEVWIVTLVSLSAPFAMAPRWSK